MQPRPERGPGALRAPRALLCALLGVATLAVYAQCLGFDFVGFDDDDYVTENPHVRNGLTAESLRWALTARHAWNWHPATWISHMLDCEIWGLEQPGGHHATSVALHVANTLLLFLVLQALTRRCWPSALIAAGFALHPLHVESVAWVAERKDVLSTLFMLLAIAAYTGYARRGGVGRYAGTAALMALGLMSKPMLVTLPCVLLLLDHWPLGRTPGEPLPAAEPRPAAGPLPAAGPAQRSLAFLVAEKLPLFALSAASSAATIWAQDPVIREIPTSARIANAGVSYAAYIVRFLWPSGLSVHYPHPDLPGGVPWAGWQIATSFLLLAAISGLVLWQRRRRHLVVGWLWFLGMLVPTLGLVQVGTQAMADRYTYVPLIGLLIMLVFGAADPTLAAGWVRACRTPLARAAVAGALLVLATLSFAQTRHWRDSIHLFEHSLRISPHSSALHNNLANALVAAGRHAEAVDHFRETLRLDPENPIAHYNLGRTLYQQGDMVAAIRHFRTSLDHSPGSAHTHIGLGNALWEQGRPEQAIEHYEQALAGMPTEAHLNLGTILLSLERGDEAIAHLEAALATEPEGEMRANVHNALGVALLSRSRVEDAREQFRWALVAHPDHPRARRNLERLEAAPAPR